MKIWSAPHVMNLHNRSAICTHRARAPSICRHAPLLLQLFTSLGQGSQAVISSTRSPVLLPSFARPTTRSRIVSDELGSNPLGWPLASAGGRSREKEVKDF